MKRGIQMWKKRKQSGKKQLCALPLIHSLCSLLPPIHFPPFLIFSSSFCFFCFPYCFCLFVFWSSTSWTWLITWATYWHHKVPMGPNSLLLLFLACLNQNCRRVINDTNCSYWSNKQALGAIGDFWTENDTRKVTVTCQWQAGSRIEGW